MSVALSLPVCTRFVRLSTTTELVTAVPLAIFFGITPLIETVNDFPLASDAYSWQWTFFGLRKQCPLLILYFTEPSFADVTKVIMTPLALDGPLFVTTTR